MNPTWKSPSSSVASNVQNVAGEDQPGAGDDAARALEPADHVALLADTSDQEHVVVDAERDEEDEREQRQRGVALVEQQAR